MMVEQVIAYNSVRRNRLKMEKEGSKICCKVISVKQSESNCLIGASYTGSGKPDDRSKNYLSL